MDKSSNGGASQQAPGTVALPHLQPSASDMLLWLLGQFQFFARRLLAQHRGLLGNRVDHLEARVEDLTK